MIERLELSDINEGDVYDIETKNRHYTLERTKAGYFITGHPLYCGIQTWCHIVGSRPSGWGTSEPGVIVVGMHLHFGTNDYDDVVTSTVVSITKMEVPTACV